jgi:hypothetical protein
VEELADSTVTRPALGLDQAHGAEPLSQEERAQLADERANGILADPDFRPGSRGDKQRIARQAFDQPQLQPFSATLRSPASRRRLSSKSTERDIGPGRGQAMRS